MKVFLMIPRQMFFCALLGFAASVNAAVEPETEPGAAMQKVVDSLHYREGDFSIDSAHATVHVRKGFHYLDAADGQKVLEDLWGNPPDDSVLGLLVPDDIELLGEHSWVVVLTYADDGHVGDEDATSIDYDKMLKEMQADTLAANTEREKSGYQKVQLIGWAAPPRYDASSRKLHWAKELAFGDSAEHTLNYDIRVLGRAGYLSMNAVASVSDLELVQSGMDQVMAMTEFNEGERYADFNSSTDKVAGYGLAALVGGAIAAKTGLFAKLLVMLLAAKKLIILGLIALAAGLKRFLGRKAD